jgi:hypothetical protein
MLWFFVESAGFVASGVRGWEGGGQGVGFLD